MGHPKVERLPDVASVHLLVSLEHGNPPLGQRICVWRRHEDQTARDQAIGLRNDTTIETRIQPIAPPNRFVFSCRMVTNSIVWNSCVTT